MDPFQTASGDIDCLRLICATPLHFGSTSCYQGKAEMNYPTCTLHRLHCSALHLSPPLSLSVASRKPVTNQRRNCQRVGFFRLPSVGHGRCGARQCARLRSSLLQQGRGWPSRRGSALQQLASRAGVSCLPLLRRSTVSGQLSVPFCICQHPRRINAASGHDSETFDLFC